MTSATSGAVPNRLAREKSPYLLQHQHNPVDWHPWGEEAFEKARAENKPIFLSIGYSTCHWCHVMERESFEDASLAAFLNQHFVSIKVDREERPDVDKIYMTSLQVMGQGGGWPLNVFLTPELKPFYGGTYFPPENRHGRPSFRQLLERIQQLWETRQNDLRQSAGQLHQQLAAILTRPAPEGLLLNPALLERAAALFKHDYDARHGGFGGAPKFPRPTQPAFLLEYGVRHADEEAVRMVLHTCERMAAGGIYDQLGGGFARYSVDAQWLVPHFEKMLYDNAQLTQLYLDAYRVSGEPRFAATARDVLHYVLRDMTHPEGGFYSAEDADSEGKEGKFYTWTKTELAQLLTPEEFNVAAGYFGVTEAGNFLDHSDPDPLLNQNVLSIAGPAPAPEDQPLLETAREKLLAARNKRVRPHLDDKVLASWNGMMLGALARAYAVLGDPEYLAAAERNLAFVRNRLWDDGTKALHHRWREGARDRAQLLESYAHYLGGVLDFYEATLRPSLLEFALDLARGMIARFYDRDQGGFWQAPPGSPDLILPVKDDYDGAEPSGNSAATFGLLRLAALTGQPEFKATAELTLRHFAERLEQLPQAVPNLLRALSFSLNEPTRIILTGDPAADGTRQLLRAAHSCFHPQMVVLGVERPVDEFARTLPARNRRSTAYLCTGTECRPPVTEPDALIETLQGAA